VRQSYNFVDGMLAGIGNEGLTPAERLMALAQMNEHRHLPLRKIRGILLRQRIEELRKNQKPFSPAVLATEFKVSVRSVYDSLEAA
jgi:hypothetical protein